VVDPAGAPVGGATVTFSCPDHGFGDGDQAETDASGRFVHQNIPDIAETCTLTVEKAGFVPKKLLRKDVAYSSRTSTLGSLPKVRLDPLKP
jgi:hypothetical protein